MDCLSIGKLRQGQPRQFILGVIFNKLNNCISDRDILRTVLLDIESEHKYDKAGV
jgi:hypothetical protein